MPVTGNHLRSKCTDILSKWRNWIKTVVMLVYGICILLLLPKLIIRSFEKKNNDPVVFIGGVFALLTIPISLVEILQHMIHYSRPPLQLHIIRILWMVPIYSINAWMGIIYPDKTIFMDSFRECYEAYVIYSFMMYLLNYLNADNQVDFEATLASKPQVDHMFPFCWLSPWKMGRELVHNCKHGILQYTVVRPLTTAIALLCELGGVYGEGEFDGDKAFPYIIAVNNCSQFIAMYCLVLFYRANREQLRPMKPIGKFLCIKAVVFFSFFQGVLVAVFVYMDVISSVFNTDDDRTIKTISSKIQNFLICIEMFLAAIAHRYSFSHHPYMDGTLQHQSLWETLMAMWDLRDVHDNIREHFTVVGSGLGNGFNSLKRAGAETTPLLADVSRTVESGYHSFTDLLSSAGGSVVDGSPPVTFEPQSDMESADGHKNDSPLV